MFRGRICPDHWRTDHPEDRRKKDDLALGLRLNSALYHALSQVELRKYIDFEIPPDQVQWNFADGSAFTDAGIVDQHIELPAHCASSVMGFQQVELFNAQTG